MSVVHQKPAVLVVPERHKILATVLAEDFEVHRYWEIKDAPEAFLSGAGRRVRACIVGGPFVPPTSFLDRLPALGLLACVSVGYENVPQNWCRAHGVAVTTGSNLNAEDVADHAVALVMATRRRILAGDQDVRAGTWVVHGQARSLSLRSAKVGIVGLGAIGTAIACRLAPFGCAISWWGPNTKPDAAWPRAASLLDLARDSDMLIVAAAATHRGMIDARVIGALGPDGILINIARGMIVDEDALITALREGRLGGAGLDVFAEEPTPASRWADVPNTVLTTHMAGATVESIEALWRQAEDNVRRFFDGRPLATPLHGLIGDDAEAVSRRDRGVVTH